MGKLFKSSYFWIIFVTIFLAALAGILLPLLGVKSAVPIILTELILVLGGGMALLLVKFLRMQKALKTRNDTGGAFGEGGSFAATWMEPLKDETRNALDILRQAGRNKVKVGQNPLNLFRFYLVMGNSGSGKSTLLDNCGVHFPRKFPDERQLAQQTTHFARWNFSTQGIFLETPARYLEGGENEEELELWLSILAKEGKGKALDGIILSLNLEELMGSNDILQKQALTLREKVAQVMAATHLDLPVYLVFTHSDLVPGFKEFFSNMQELEAGQVLGATFPIYGNLAPARTRFEREFRSLIENIRHRIPERLAQVGDAVERRRIFVFPNELAAAEEKLAAFVESLFKTTMRKETALLRGFFFTSVTLPQTEKALGAAFADSPGSGSQTLYAHPLNPRARQPSESIRVKEEKPQVRALFTSLLFSGILKNDRDLARTTSHRQGTLSRNALFSFVALVSASVLLSLYATVGWLKSRSLLGKVSDSVVEAARADYKRPAGFRSDFGVLEQLYQRIEWLDREKEKGRPWLVPPGFHHMSEARKLAHRMHHHALHKMVGRTSVRTLRASLALDVDHFTPAERQSVYNKLKLYLAMTDQGRPHLDNVDRAELGLGLSGFWSQDLSSLVGPGNLPTNFEASLEKHASLYAARHLKQDPAFVTETDKSLVKRAREKLRGSPSIEGLYQSILHGTRGLQDIGLSEMGIPDDALMQSSDRVRGFYTKDGHPLAVKYLKEGAREPHRKDWVIGEEAPMTLPVEMRDERKLEKALLDRYYQEYHDEWMRFLGSIRVDVPEDFVLASTKIISFTSTEQGLPRTFTVLMEQVDLRPKETVADKEIEKKLKGHKFGRLAQMARDQMEDPREMLYARFEPMERVVAQQSGGILNNYFTSVRQLGEELGNMGLANDNGEKVMTFAKDLFAGNKSNALAASAREVNTAMGQVPDAVREWLQPLLEKPVVSSARMVTAACERNLDAQYREEVLRFYNENVAGRYPFTRGVPNEASVDKLYVFFNKTDGKFSIFVKDKLGPFVSQSQGRFAPKVWKQGLQVRFHAQALDMMERGLKVADRLYTEGSKNMRPYPLELTLREVPNTAGARLSITGTTIEVKPGKGIEKQRLRWPGEQLYEGATLEVSFVNGTRQSLKEEGPWGWLRLMDKTKNFKVRDGGFEAMWRFRVGGTYDVDVRVEGSVQDVVNPFTFEDFYKFSCPPNLINQNLAVEEPAPGGSDMAGWEN